MGEFPVKKMSAVLKVSKSGYYRWLKDKASQDSESALLDEKIKTIFEQSDKVYGSPRIYLALQRMGIEVSESTVARRMKRLELTPKGKKRFKNTTDSKHNMPIAPNILNRNLLCPDLIRGSLIQSHWLLHLYK